MAELKLDDAGHVVVQDGKPVYVIDGKDTPFDYLGTVGTIGRLNGEAKTHREAKEAALARLQTFDGIEDAAKARDALALVSKLDAKALIDAGQVDTIKAEAERAWAEKLKATEERYKPVVRERDEFRNRYHNEIINSAFGRSKFIAEKLAVPIQMVEATFGRHFAVEADKLVGKDLSGNAIYSRARPGELATFDEAIEMLVEASPFRDSVLKGSGASGSGAHGGNGKAGSKALPRAAFFALSPAEQMAHVKSGGTVTE